MRKTQTLKITTEGRDNGKVFRLTEMSAAQAERWAIKALFALANTGVELPDDFQDSGFAGIAAVGFRALAMLPFEAAEPLLAEMWTCVQFQPDPSKEIVRFLMDEDIEEVSTRLQIRKAVWDMHIGFFLTADPST